MDIRFAKRTELMDSSVVRKTLKLTAQPDIISFAGGMPAPEVFPVEAMRAASDKVLTTAGPMALQYGPSDGYRPLREKIAARHRREGMACRPEDILMINGSQQGLDLAGKLFLDPGDLVVCENPTYTAALSTFRSYECGFLPIDTDDDGMILEDLERKLAANPRAKLIYVIPTFQNPTGRTWSLERRKGLLALAEQYHLPILEDNPYGELRFEGEYLPALKSMDTKGLVVFLGTFSKILAPGYRLGWVCADGEILAKYNFLAQAASLQASTEAQLVVSKFIDMYDLDEHVATIKDCYRKRRDVMMATMEREFPEEAKFTHPNGGLFTWVELPEYINTNEMAKECLKRNVAYVPGDGFFPDAGHNNCIRLNYSCMPEDKIEKGMTILGQVIKEYIKK